MSHGNGRRTSQRARIVDLRTVAFRGRAAAVPRPSHLHRESRSSTPTYVMARESGHPVFTRTAGVIRARTRARWVARSSRAMTAIVGGVRSEVPLIQLCVQLFDA